MALNIISDFNKESNLWEMDVIGELDVYTAPKLRASIDGAFSEKECDIIMNLANLNYIDSTGLGVMIGAYGRMQEKSKKVSIINPKPNVEKLLKITSLDRIFLTNIN